MEKLVRGGGREGHRNIGRTDGGGICCTTAIREDYAWQDETEQKKVSSHPCCLTPTWWQKIDGNTMWQMEKKVEILQEREK